MFPTLNLKLNTDGCEKIDEKIKHYLSNIGCNNAYQTGILPLGPVSDLGPFIKIESSDNTAVRINEDKLKILKSNIGLSAIISTSLDWNASKDLIDRCNLFLSSITNYSHTFHNLDCEDNNWFNRIVDGISTSLLNEIHNILTANKIKINPNEALHIASNYRLIDINGDKCVTTPDALTTIILKTFGIDV